MSKVEQKLIRLIEEEIESRVKNIDLHTLIGDLVKQKIEKELNPIIKLVVEKQVENVNKKLKQELHITKQLTYSIDSEIKHTLMKLPTDYQQDLDIKKIILEKLGSITLDTKETKIEYKKDEI